MNQSILRLAVPNIISNISVPLVSAVDTMLMGHLSTLHLAALGIASMIFIFIYGIMNFLRSGTTGMSAQSFGAEDSKGVTYTLYRALLVAFLIGLAILLLQEPIKELSFYLLNIDSSYQEYASCYYDIRIATAPAVFLLYVLMGWFFGLQNALYPLLITLLVNGVNIALSYLLVVKLGWGIEGAAYGTLIAQYAGVVFALLLLLKYKERLFVPDMTELLQRSLLLRFFRVNSDIFIRTVMLTFAFGFFNAQAAKGGTQTLALMVLLPQFVLWFSYIIDGFANAAESLVGKYYGAKDWQRLDRVLKLIFIWGFGFAFLFTILYTFFTEELVSLYTNQSSLQLAIGSYIPYLALMPIFSFGAFLWDSVYIGMTASRAMRNSVTVATLLFVGLFYLSKSFNAELALWLTFLAFFLFRALLQSYLFWKYRYTLV
jgi:MATE family multidrug resistance protein